MKFPRLFRYASVLALLFTADMALAAETALALPPPVPGFPIGRCVLTQNITSPEDAKTAGFEYLEVNLPELLPLSDEEFAKTVARLRSLGIPLLSGYGFVPANLKLVGPDLDELRIDAELRHSLDRARELGLSMVVHGNVIAGTRRAPEGFSLTEARKQFRDFCVRAAAEGKARGITVLIQPMGVKSSNVINTVAEGLALIEEVNSPNLQLLVDFSSMVEGKENFAILRRAAPHIRQIEIQNPNGRIYPIDAGEADYVSFFRALKAGGYRGGFSIHGKPGDFWVNAPRAITLLRGLARAELWVAPADATRKSP